MLQGRSSPAGSSEGWSGDLDVLILSMLLRSSGLVGVKKGLLGSSEDVNFKCSSSLL